jgi:hypothetical protein
MAQLIVLNASNFDTNTTNRMVLNLPNGADLRNMQVSLQSASVPYSWRNITTDRGNNSLSYLWNGVNFNIVIPDGFYSIAELSEYIKFVMEDNGHYLVNADGINVYYLSLAVNPVYYRVTLTLTAVPAVLPMGWTNPEGIVLNGLAPQFVVNDNSFGALVGFSIGTYPAVQGGSTELNGDLVPNVTVYSAISISCNLVNNRYQNNQSLYTFVPSGAYGNYITVEPINPVRFDVRDQQWDVIELLFRDQTGAALVMIDYDITVSLLLTPART